MILKDVAIEEKALLDAAGLICLAARTAPKGKGQDQLETLILTGEEKDGLCRTMRAISERDELPFFARDAGNISQSPVLILLGTRFKPLGLHHCGFCGFPDCGALTQAGGLCAFNTGDLGIAIGSAVSRAADLRLDNRIMYTAGKAALEDGLMPSCRVIYGIPLSVTGKSPFFDRK